MKQRFPVSTYIEVVVVRALALVLISLVITVTLGLTTSMADAL